MKVGDYVSTKNGNGFVADIEYYNRIDGGTKRYGIKLDNSPFFYQVAYYFPHEIRSVIDGNQNGANHD